MLLSRMLVHLTSYSPKMTNNEEMRNGNLACRPYAFHHRIGTSATYSMEQPQLGEGLAWVNELRSGLFSVVPWEHLENTNRHSPQTRRPSFHSMNTSL